MSSMLCSQGVAVATAMAVSGTVIVLALHLQKSLPTAQFSLHQSPISTRRSLPTTLLPLRSCLSSDGKKSKKKKKKVHFAQDMMEPRGNGDEFRRHCDAIGNAKMSRSSSSSANAAASSPPPHASRDRGIPANRLALYSGILRDRGVQRLAYSH
ncbi:hypothetical protein LINGRAHAP2_LOCUS2260 [Linum grandiflorum]